MTNVFANYTVKRSAVLRGTKFRVSVNNLLDKHSITGQEGGTLEFASGYLRDLFFRKFKEAATNPQYSNDQQFRTAFTTMFQSYNPGKDGYGTGVMTKATSHQPVLGQTIF